VAFALPTVGIKLHRNQFEVFNNPSRFRVVVAGRRFGKTVLARAEISRASKGSGRRLIWYVCPTFQMAREIMWDELCESIPEAWVKKKHETRLEIRLINGTVIQLKGADRPDTLRGRGVYFVILDEYQDFRPEVWEKVIYPTLTTTRGRALIIGTPKGFTNFYGLYTNGQQRANRMRQEWWSWQFKSISSPFFPPSEIANARANLDPKTFKQEFEASFETMAGRVYYAFDRKVHIGDYPFNPSRPFWVGQDFNIDPMSSVIIQEQDDGELWVVDEIHLPNSNTQEVCDELDRRYYKSKSLARIYPDPAGANRNQGRGESNLDVFRDAGYKAIFYKRKHPRVSDRVQTVNSLLLSADGRIRLKIDAKCKKLIESFEQTIYKAGRAEIDKSMSVEHATDALGYPLHYVFGERMKAMGVSI
jgi:hypothetical protein